MSRLSVGLIACVGLWLMVSLAWGNTSADYLHYLRQVKRFYRDGVQLTNRKQFKRAAVFYLEALRWVRKAMPMATVPQRKRLHRSEGSFLYVIGRNYQMGGSCRLAVKYYRQTLKSAASLPVKAKVTGFLQQAIGMPACRPVKIEIHTTPGAAQIVLSSGQRRMTGQTPWQGEVAPGRWKLLLQHPASLSQRHIIEIKPQQPHTFRYTFVATTPPKTPARPAARQAPMWPRWLLLGGAVALVAGGAVALGWSGSEFATVSQLQGKPIDGVSEPDTYSVLKARVDGGAAGMAAGGAMMGVGAIVGGIAAWWLLQPSTPPKSSYATPSFSHASTTALQLHLDTPKPKVKTP